MSFLHCILFTLLYLECGARNKNPSLDQLKGLWIVSNASENALSLIADCTSVEIEPPPKKSHNNKGTIWFKTEKTINNFTISAIDQSTYEIYEEELSRLAKLRVLKVEKDTFIVAEVEVKDETYYAVLMNDKKTSQKVENKIRKFWNSSDVSKNVSLFPIKQENCKRSTEGSPTEIEVDSVLITSITIEDTYISDLDSENEVPILQSDNVQNTSFEINHLSDEISAEVTSNRNELRPHITIKLRSSTESTTSRDSSDGFTPSTKTVTQTIHPNDKVNNSITTERSISARRIPDLIFVLLNLMLFTI